MAIIFEGKHENAPQNKRITEPCTWFVNMHGIAQAPEALRSTFAKSFRDGPGNGGKEAADDNAEFDQFIDNTENTNAERDPVSCETEPEGILVENVITFLN